MVTIKWHHADHALTEAQRAHVEAQAEAAPDGRLWLAVLPLPAALGTAPCGLHGPSMGDPPVPEAEVTYARRGDREQGSRLVARPPRPVASLVAIGLRTGDAVAIFTAYGGTSIAPREPWNVPPDEREALAEAEAFWAIHALSAG